MHEETKYHSARVLDFSGRAAAATSEDVTLLKQPMLEDGDTYKKIAAAKQARREQNLKQSTVEKRDNEDQPREQDASRKTSMAIDHKLFHAWFDDSDSPDKEIPQAKLRVDGKLHFSVC